MLLNKLNEVMNKHYLKLKVSLGIDEMYKVDDEQEEILAKIKIFQKAMKLGKGKYIVSK